MLHRLFPFAPANQPVWAWMKDVLTTALGVSDDTMHMGVGLLILTIAALVLRRAPWSLWPWLAVLAAETLNEAYDLTHGTDEGNWRDSWHDFWITLLWPTIVLLIWSRWDPRRAARRSALASGDEVEQPLE